VPDLAEVLELADTLANANDEVGESEPIEAAPETVAEIAECEPEELAEMQPEPGAVEETAPAAPIKPTVSERFFETLANAGGFYGRPVEIELDMESASLESWEADEAAPSEEPGPAEPASVDEAPADELAPPEEPFSQDQPQPTSEGHLQSKLTDVRAKADEARQAKLRANAALYEGLSAAYDFALDAEEAPEEYLKLVEAEGIKIQLRSPMKPVAKLAFDGMCDDVTIKQLEAILAWAFEEELPRGTLAERIEAEGGIGPILSGERRAA
jgi:hypothetical protein